MKAHVLVALAMAIAAASSKAAVVIGDFEAGTDGWVSLSTSTAVQGTAWAATGTHSLLITANDWPTVNLENSATALAAMPLNDKIELTVHSLAGNLQGPTGIHMIISAAGNGTGGHLSSINDDYGNLSIGDGSADNTAVLTWTYDPTRLQSVVDGGLIWWQITLNTEGDKPAQYAIDNVTVVPEPASGALLAIPSLLLMRRKH